jgi:glutamyl-tRNA synthetase
VVSWSCESKTWIAIVAAQEFTDVISVDLRWLGLDRDEGPDVGGPFAPYVQSQRRRYYLEAREKLRVGGFVYPCKCSRKDVMQASLAPHEEEAIYPGTCRPRGSAVEAADTAASTVTAHLRFRVPDGQRIDFVDEHLGKRSAVAGRDFGDFIIWRRNEVPAYQLAVVVDDATMQISEVVARRRFVDVHVSAITALSRA